MQKSTLFSLAIVGTMLFASCEKDLYDPNQVPEKEVTVAGLMIPADFSWEMSQQVTCTINTPQASIVSIYPDETYPEEFLATFTAKPNDKATVLSVPIATQTLYLQYETSEGVKKSISAPIKADKSVVFTLPVDSRVQTRTATTRDENSNGLFLYPANWGTILFEDMFPQIGDYDFNDFVAKYQIGLTNVSEANSHFVANMRVSMYIYAVGGTLPYTPYFRLVGVDKKNIDLSSIRILGTILNNPTPSVTVEVVETSGNELVLEFRNATKNPYKKPGSPFLNTEPGFMTKLAETTQISITFNFKNKNLRLKDLQEPAIDFFLANENRSKEVHLRGYKPVFSKSADFGLHSEVSYSTDNNLVWAIKIPTSVRHANERANFCKAYTHFAAWAQSGGKEYQNWYDRAKPGYADATLLVKWP